jgi:hypothetical protein
LESFVIRSTNYEKRITAFCLGFLLFAFAKLMLKCQTVPVTIAATFLGAGLLVIALLSFKRRPRLLESWLFITLVLLLVGMVSLGVTGSAVAFVFTPLLNLIGFPSSDLRSSWLGAMALSFLCPPGLVFAHGVATLKRSSYWLLFGIGFLLYLFLAGILVYYIVESV